MLTALVLSTAAVTGPPAVDWGPPNYFAVDFAASSYSDEPGTGRFLRTLSLSGRGGRRWGRWGLGLAGELNLWAWEDLDSSTDALGAWLLGIDGEVRMVGGRVRSRISGGLAFLLEGTDDDEAGDVGFYFETRPVGFRWPFENWLLGFDPLGMMLVVPSVSGIPLVDVQFRTAFYAEFGL